MLDRLDELEKQKDQIGARLAKARPPLPCIHPNVAEIYRAKIQRLDDALARPDDAREAAQAMRGLIDKIVLTPGKKRGEVKAELYGELAAILALTSGQKPRPTEDQRDMRFSVVAGERHQRYLQDLFDAAA
jgi:hypothetical protein